MWTNDFIRIPFKERGRSREGVDCWGLVCVIYKEMLNIDLPQFLNYKNTNDKQAILNIYAEQAKKWNKVPVGEEEEFDVVVLKMMGLPTHVGVVCSKGFMIHCEMNVGTTVVEYSVRKHQWSRRLTGFYRYADSSSVITSV